MVAVVVLAVVVDYGQVGLKKDKRATVFLFYWSYWSFDANDLSLLFCKGWMKDAKRAEQTDKWG